ncbi:MAG: 2-C-methyl-D-erythritol 2,4-cyclodiphosphate synthase [Bacillota bacterium]|jgi:2-C-methyl-D-erythritol 2,4-cyclodiphosphate synthase
MRVGIGYDVHKLVEDRKLILGGVEIPYEKGLLGHSDADVLVHAIMDALLGAAALGDIGQLYPDTDPRYKDADSLALLRDVIIRIQAAGFRVINVDAVIMAEKPKMAPHIPEMKQNIAEAMRVGTFDVGLKATTTEGLGFVGSGEGIAAQAVALIENLHPQISMI